MVHIDGRCATGDRPLDKIEPERIEQMVARMRRNGAGPKVIHNALTLLRQVFGFGQRKGWCQVNPTQAVDRPKVEQTPTSGSSRSRRSRRCWAPCPRTARSAAPTERCT